MRNKKKYPVVPKNVKNAVLHALKLKRTYFILTVLLIIVVALSVHSADVKSRKFNDRDYASVSDQLGNLYSETNISDVAQQDSCSLERPGEFDAKKLYCSINTVGFVDYSNDAAVVEVIKKLEDNLTAHAVGGIYFSDFFKNPSQRIGTAVINVRTPKLIQCTVSVESKDKAVSSTQTFIRKATANQMIVSFHCSHESLKPYFPITYIQG